MPKKRFDKKNADRYTLVNRSQQDPTTHTQENATEKVLHPVGSQSEPKLKLPEESLASDQPELPKDDQNGGGVNYGVDTGEVDPEIMAALESEGEDDWEELDDDFVRVAMMERIPDEVERTLKPKTEYWDKVKDEDYEMSSEEEIEIKKKVLRDYTSMDLGEDRNFFEERFEKVFKDYEDDDDGSEYDYEEGEEEEEYPPLNQYHEAILDEFLQTNHKLKHEDGVSEETRHIIETAPSRKSKTIEFEYLTIKEEDPFDCQSITSTYSNLYNHPKLIDEPTKSKNKIELSAKSGLPLGVLKEKERKQKPVGENKGVARKDETAEEKKERKKQIKAERKANRENKKSLKNIYKNEQLNQMAVKAHTQSTIKL
eukprot:TRINITY_DN5431_c0_g1_i1.p1 TRINITY_DN5431_c0_g1~~TRINITY_DN5431_c0_g1_i1.p1  ORF type:complete len:370 (-),score=149.24 TRINITY_DN5431_c0_g1_i1:17-1126(-)